MKRLLITLTLISLCAFAYAADGGRTALPFLKMDMGARYFGMAGAATAYADDVTGAVFYNPAALGRVKSLELAAATFEDKLDMKAYHATAGLPMPYLSFFGHEPMRIAFHAYIYDKGDMEYNSSSVSVGKDMSFQISLAERALSHQWDLAGTSATLDHYVGISGKYLRSTLPNVGGGNVKADAFALDAGYMAIIDEHFGLGIALKNLGTDIKYIEVEEDLPTTLSLGAFLTLVDTESVNLALSGGYINYIKEKESRIRIGAEFILGNFFAVRGGVKLMEEIQNEYALGAGLKLFGFSVDFGTIINPQLNDDKMYQISVSYKFPLAKEEPARQGQQKRATYYESQQQQMQQSQERAIRNTSPIIYQ